MAAKRLLLLALLTGTLPVFQSAFAEVFKTIGSFDGTNGAQPWGSLVMGTNGFFYGTTVGGGDFAQGAIYTATTAGDISLLASFDGTNGAQPFAGLTPGPNGLFYGTTSSGGAYNTGTVFTVTYDGIINTLYSFDGANSGGRPLSPLLLGLDGNFYGTTSSGGISNAGTLFVISPSGGFTTLAVFTGPNGAQPSGSLAQSTVDGTIYGTTLSGGANGQGAVFFYNPPLAYFPAVPPLRSFTGGADGATPRGGLIYAPNGILYGTTTTGSTNGDGTIFSINPPAGWSFATLHAFGEPEGINPIGGLLQPGNGVLYGTTTGGGGRNRGTVFSFRPGVGLTNLNSFTAAEGGTPAAALVVGTNGNIFGVTSTGGQFGLGTLFQLSQISPFALIGPTNRVVIAGQSVTFNVVPGGSAPVKFQWQFNSKNLSDNKTISGARTSALTISNVSTNDAGTYTVLIQNAEGQFLSAAATLTVIPTPSIRITSPSSGSQVKSPEVTLSGTTGKELGVTIVHFRLNGGDWLPASTSDNWKHWQADVTVPFGTNVVDAFAESVLATYSQTNTVLFVSPPFIPVQGSYNGLFGGTNGFSPENSGFLTLKLNFSGNFSGRLQMAGASSSFKGQFDSDGNATAVIPRSRQTPLTAFLHLDLAAPDDRITGTITNESWAADLLACRAIFDSRTNPAPFSGRYTFTIPASPGTNGSPGGDSFGTLTVSTAGKITASVSLADNTRFTQNVPACGDGTWPFFAPLYSGKGVILGWMSFSNPAPSILGGNVNWFKPAVPKSKYYADGFLVASVASGGVYQATNLVGFFGGTNAEVVLQGGELAGPITNQVTVTSKNKITDVDKTNRLSLSFSQSAGTFQGSIAEPGAKSKLTFRGVLREDLGAAGGFFLGTNQSGQVMIQP